MIYLKIALYVLGLLSYGKIVNYHFKEKIKEMEVEIKSLREVRGLEKRKAENEIELLNGTIKLMRDK